MLVLKDVLNMVKNLVLQGGGARVPTRQVPYRQKHVLFKSENLK